MIDIKQVVTKEKAAKFRDRLSGLGEEIGDREATLLSAHFGAYTLVKTFGIADAIRIMGRFLVEAEFAPDPDDDDDDDDDETPPTVQA